MIDVAGVGPFGGLDIGGRGLMSRVTVRRGPSTQPERGVKIR
jgi:hypothetical protein